MNQIEQLARAFSQKLRHYLSEHEMSQVISLNESEEDPCICHSHDFCDANEAMQDAFIKLFGRSCNFSGRVEYNADLDIWNKSWAMAKENKFYQ